MNSISGYDKWLTTPPDDDPICEDGCGETLVRNHFSDGWFCGNGFCPTKYQGVEKQMAEALVDALEEIRTLKAIKTRLERSQRNLIDRVRNSGLE